MLNNALHPLPGDACRWQTKPALSLPRPPKRAVNQHRNGMSSTARNHAQAHGQIARDSNPIWRRKAFACSILNSGRSRRGISVEVGGLEALLGVAVTVDCNQLTHPAPSRMIAFAVEDKINGLGRL